jgi:hypothetical protein
MTCRTKCRIRLRGNSQTEVFIDDQESILSGIGALSGGPPSFGFVASESSSCVGARRPCPSARTRSCLRAARVARRRCACRADEPASATPRPPNAAPRAVAAADCRCRPCHRAPPAAGAGTARRGKRGEREGGAEPRGRVVLRCGEGLAPARAAAAACSHAGCHRWRPRRTLPPLCRSLLTPGSLRAHSVDPFSRKEWYDVKAPSTFAIRNACKTCVNRTSGTSA